MACFKKDPAKEKITWKQHMQHMWFFQSKIKAVITSVLILIFLSVNVVIFVDKYDFWSRIYAFFLCAAFLATVVAVVIYWKIDASNLAVKTDWSGIKMISTPLIAMTIFMAVGSFLGYLHFFYFLTIFTDCDSATQIDTPWQLASDFIYYLTLMIAFIIYPGFIFRSYVRPIAFGWRWLLYLVTGTLVILFCQIGFHEAYETYVHLCDNTYVLKHNWCPTLIERHHFSCSGENFTEVQELWINMHEQVMGPGIFLIVAEYLPLLFVLIWMAPVHDEAGKTHSTFKHFTKEAQDEVLENNESSLKEIEETQPALQNCAAEEGGSDNSAEPPLNGDSIEQEVWVQKDGKTTVLARGVQQTPKVVKMIVSFCSVLTFLVMLIRLGLLLNHVGRHPTMELAMEAGGHFASATVWCFLFGLSYFLWLMKIDLKRLMRHAVRLGDSQDLHHLAHAKFDAFLLKIASFLITLQILVNGVAELDFTSWAGPFYIVHKFPVIISVWLQYIAVAKALKLESLHWKTVGRSPAFCLALTALCANFLEWVAQFVKRRYMVFVLDTGEPITAVAVASIALSEMLYPALSFYYFHALLCWLVIFWHILKADKSANALVARHLEDNGKSGVRDSTDPESSRL